MATLIFDIETLGEAWESFDTVSQKTLTRWIKRTTRTKDEYELEPILLASRSSVAFRREGRERTVGGKKGSARIRVSLRKLLSEFDSEEVIDPGRHQDNACPIRFLGKGVGDTFAEVY